MQRLPHYLIFIISVNDLISNVFMLASPPADQIPSGTNVHGQLESSWCTAQAAGYAFFRLATILWTIAMAMLPYLFAFTSCSSSDWAARALAITTFLVYLVPLIAVVVGKSQHVYGYSNGMCSIDDEHNEWRLILQYSWIWIATIINVRRRLHLHAGVHARARARLGASDHVTMFPSTPSWLACCR